MCTYGRITEGVNVSAAVNGLTKFPVQTPALKWRRLQLKHSWILMPHTQARTRNVEEGLVTLGKIPVCAQSA